MDVCAMCKYARIQIAAQPNRNSHIYMQRATEKKIAKRMNSRRCWKKAYRVKSDIGNSIIYYLRLESKKKNKKTQSYTAMKVFEYFIRDWRLSMAIILIDASRRKESVFRLGDDHPCAWLSRRITRFSRILLSNTLPLIYTW